MQVLLLAGKQLAAQACIDSCPQIPVCCVHCLDADLKSAPAVKTHACSCCMLTSDADCHFLLCSTALDKLYGDRVGTCFAAWRHLLMLQLSFCANQADHMPAPADFWNVWLHSPLRKTSGLALLACLELLCGALLHAQVHLLVVMHLCPAPTPLHTLAGCRAAGRASRQSMCGSPLPTPTPSKSQLTWWTRG